MVTAVNVNEARAFGPQLSFVYGGENRRRGAAMLSNAGARSTTGSTRRVSAPTLMARLACLAPSSSLSVIIVMVSKHDPVIHILPANGLRFLNIPCLITFGLPAVYERGRLAHHFHRCYLISLKLPLL